MKYNFFLEYLIENNIFMNQFTFNINIVDIV